MAETGSQPVLLLGLDGVLLTDATPNSPHTLEEQCYIAYNPAHGTWLNRLHDQDVDIRYISDWQYRYRVTGETKPTDSVHGCHDLVGKDLQLPVFEEFDYVHIGHAAGTAGRLAASQIAFMNRPLIWLDDELTPAVYRWASQRAAPTLLIQPEHTSGLQADHIHRVSNWLAELVVNTIQTR